MKKFFQALIRNLPAKIISILISTGLWIYVGMGQAQTGTFPGRIPLEFRHTPSGLVAISDIDSVSIKIVASSNEWKTLGASSFSAVVDLTGLNEGAFEVPIRVNTNISEVQIIEVNPNKIFVKLEKVVKKEVPINLQIDGQAGEGYVVGDWGIVPSNTEVSGASSIVDKILEATARVTLAGEKETVKKIVRLAALDAQGNEIRNLEFNPQEVSVELPLVKASSVKSVGIKVITSGQPADGFWISQIETDPSSVAITASEALINKISFLETREVDVTGLDQSKELKITLKSNPGVIVLDNVDKIKIKITISAISSTRQIKTGFSWLNLSDNLKVVSADPQAVTVILVGSATDLARLDSNDVTVNIDLRDFARAGAYSLDISSSDIILAEGISFSSIIPTAINIMLETR